MPTYYSIDFIKNTFGLHYAMIYIFCTNTYYSIRQMIKLQKIMRPARDWRLWGQNLHVIEAIRMPTTFLSGYL